MQRKKSFLETHPDIAAEWHPTKNGDLTPDHSPRVSLLKKDEEIWGQIIETHRLR